MWQQQANSSQVTHLSDRINISPLELSFQFIRIKSRLDRHMVGSVHLICISQTKGGGVGRHVNSQGASSPNSLLF